MMEILLVSKTTPTVFIT